MKKEVYTYLLKTYGRLPLLWVSVAFETLRTLIQRIFSIIVLAWIATSVVKGDIDGAKRVIIYFVIMYAAGAVLGVIGQLLAIHATDKKYEELLLDYHKKLVSKDMSFYRDHQTGYLASLFRQHLDGTMALVRLFRIDIIHMLISLTFPAIVLLMTDWKVGLVATAIVLVQVGYIMWASSKADKYRKPAQEIYRKLTGEVSDDMTNAIAFKSGGGESEARERVAKLAKEEAKTFWLRHSMVAILDAPRIIITAIGMGAGFYIALSGAARDPQSVGLILMLFTYMFQIMRNVGDLPDLVHRNDEHVSRVYPTLEYLGDKYETVRDPENPKDFNVLKGAIDMKGLGFGYKSEQDVFKDLDLHIKAGEKIGIVGLSGVGKSTLVGLIMRFDDVNRGSISIDGTDIRDVRQSDLRKQIAYVPQEPLLFHRSIRDNITYFKKDATDDDVVRVSKAAHAHEFIDKLSDKYNSLVGERGIKLSGGQKQRVVIARAMLKNAPIMIFDEATSALDSESERIIQDALPEIIGPHTAIVIAHRLSTVARMDRIIVVHEGNIDEQGTHTELLAKKGRYKAMWDKQVSSSKL